LHHNLYEYVSLRDISKTRNVWLFPWNVIQFILVISRRSFLLVGETRVPRENYRHVASHRQTLSHKVVSSTPRLNGFELTTLVAIGTDLCIGSYKSNYQSITTTTAPDCIILKWRKCSNGKTEKFKKNYNTMWHSYIHIIQCRI
jgi:hypothetical protein